MTTTQFALALAVVILGATVQGSIGFGLNLVVSPVLALIDPMLLPMVALLIALPLNIGVVSRDRQSVALRPLGWALVGRVVGSIAGTALLITMTERGVGILFGVAILSATALSASTFEIPVNRRTLAVAGLVSGVGATTIGVGGPPMGILLQRSTGAQLRGQMGGFLLAGVIASLAILGVAGQVTMSHLTTAAGLLPGVLVGFLLAGRLRGRVDGDRLRVTVLLVAGTSAAVVLARALT